MSNSINNRVDIGQISRVQQPSTTEKASTTSTADKLQDKGTAAEQLKTKLESFKTGASDLFEKSKAGLAIGSGVSLIGLAVVSGIMLSPIAIPGMMLGAAIGAAISKSQTAKDAFGGKGNIVDAGLTIGSCLTYGLGLIGTKLIEYGVNKNRLDKDNKASQADEKASVKQKSEEKVGSNKISKESKVSAENTTSEASKLTLAELEKKLIEVKSNRDNHNKPRMRGRDETLLSADRFVGEDVGLFSQIEGARNKIFNIEESRNREVVLKNEALVDSDKIVDNYLGYSKVQFGYLINEYELTPDNKKDEFLKNLTNEVVNTITGPPFELRSHDGRMDLDRIKKDLTNYAGLKKESAFAEKLISNYDKEVIVLNSEIEGLSKQLNEFNNAYDKEIESLESQIKILNDVESAKPKELTDEELIQKNQNRARVEGMPVTRNGLTLE